MKPSRNAKKRIFSFSYDESLLRTRQLMLEQAGFTVVSALGFTETLEKIQDDCKFDLVLAGHSVPPTDKVKLITAIKQHCKAPVLSILRHGYPKLPEADYAVDSHDGPQALLDAVHSALGL